MDGLSCQAHYYAEDRFLHAPTLVHAPPFSFLLFCLYHSKFSLSTTAQQSAHYGGQLSETDSSLRTTDYVLT